jgi:hypothetical protein
MKTSIAILAVFSLELLLACGLPHPIEEAEFSPPPNQTTGVPNDPDVVTIDPNLLGYIKVPSSIASNCSSDVTVALNNWLPTVPNNSTILFAKDGCYRVEGTLRVFDRRGLVFNGNGARIVQMTTPAASPKTTAHMWFVQGGSNITFRNFTLQGSNPTPNFDVNREWHGLFALTGVQTASITNVKATNAWGDFVILAPDTRNPAAHVTPTNISITYSTIDTIGRNGVSLTGCENVTIDQNTFTNIGYQVFDIEVEASNWYARSIAITKNTIGGKISLSVLVNAGIGHDITNVTFAGNVMTSTPVTCEAPVYVLDTPPVQSQFFIQNNQLRTLGASARIAGVSGMNFLDNVTTLVPGGGCLRQGTAVWIADSSGTIRGNDFVGFTNFAYVSGTVTGQACGNRVGSSAFNLPTACPL